MLGALLRHPAVRPLKQATKDAWWRYKGRSITNPPMPAEVRSVLFVCLGNICRSPFAEAIAAKHAGPARASSIRFTSAGIRTKQAAEPPPEARAVARDFGVSLDGHRPRPLTRELMDAHDIIVVMESAQRDELHAAFPGFEHRIFLLPLFDTKTAGMERYNIADPFARPRATYEACYQRIDVAVSALIQSMGRVG